MMEAMASLSQDVGVQKACVALGVARASFYRCGASLLWRMRQKRSL